MYFYLVYWIWPCLCFLFKLSASFCCPDLSFMWLKLTFCFLNMPATWQLLFISLYQLINYLCMYVCISPSFSFQILPANTSFHDTAFYYQVFVCQSRQKTETEWLCSLSDQSHLHKRVNYTNGSALFILIDRKNMWHYWMKLNETALWNNNWIWKKELAELKWNGIKHCDKCYDTVF